MTKRFVSLMSLIVTLFSLAPLTAAPSKGQPLPVASQFAKEARRQARDPRTMQLSDDDRLSPMGRLAQLAQEGKLDELIAGAKASASRKKALANGKGIVPSLPNFFEPDGPGPAGGQAELSVAVDSTGQNIVIGANDTRGFALNPVSLSGFAYSSDGGATFTNGGVLPVNPPTTTIGATIYPRVFGDPEVRYLGGSTFIYISIMVKTISATGTAQTMCVHRSTNNGQTWAGPFEIPPATNPHGLLTGANASDAADKEFADIDPETGRVMMSWSNFTSTVFAPGGVEISTTYSDDILTATPPTWSPRVIVGATVLDGQSSIPRFAKGSPNAYVAWRQFSAAGNLVGFSRSIDNGATWSLGASTSAPFKPMDQVLGNDRVNTSPSMAVDKSSGPRAGTIYLVYSNNDAKDGADVAFQKSTDGGLTFSLPTKINSRVGNDRAQWFPWVVVDDSSGRVYVHYYDQGIATSGDLTETTYLYSDDGGSTWNAPAPLTDVPFHAGYGNDTGQPNIGDYNQAIAQNGEYFAVWSGTSEVGYADGEPASTSFTVPDIFFKRVAATVAKIPLALGTVSFTDAGGATGGLANTFVDPGETITLTLPLRNYLSAGATLTTVAGVLSTSTPGVTVSTAAATYGSIAPGATANGTAYVLQLSNTFVPGTTIVLSLAVSSNQGSVVLSYNLYTGTPIATPLLSENFNGVAAGTLPVGWAPSHAGGTNTVPWTTNSSAFGTASNMAFHINANDAPVGGNPTRFERLFSPQFTVPANSLYVTLDMDVAYDSEDDSNFNIQAYDGFLLRVTDFTAGRILRSVALEAFARDFKTGSSDFYPKHMPRNNSAAYLQDLSAWAGFSNGFKHVSAKLPGMQGSTAQLRFEYTQDSGGICSDVRPGTLVCGVAFDNVILTNVVAAATTATSLTSNVNPAAVGATVTFTASVTSPSGVVGVGSVTFSEGATVLAAAVPVNASGVATFATSTLTAGVHSIIATYVPAGVFLGSTSNTYLQVICAVITLSPVPLPDGVATQSYSQTVSASGATGPYTFAVTAGALPTGLTLSAAGLLSGVPTVTGPFSFTLRATDANGCTGSQAYTVTITCPVLTLSPTTGALPNASAGQPYSQMISASGGAGPYTFAVTAGTLPAGITLSSAGLLSGTANSLGTSSFTVTATDSANSCTGSASYSLTVVCPTITLSPATLPNGVAGTAYSQNITSSGGVGASTFAVTAGTLPTGLTLSAAGLLSGTPTAAGTFNFTVTATDSNSCTGSRAYSLTVVCPTITVSPATLAGGQDGQPYSQSVTASGGVGSYTFSVTAGAVPTGLTLSSAGVLSGTPSAAGAFTFTVTASDSNACTGSRAYTVNIIARTPVISSLSPNTACQSSAAFTITVNGSNFQNGAFVRWNGSNRVTTFVSPSQLTASITSADLATPGNSTVTVLNPDAQVSNGSTFLVTADITAPVVTAPAPAKVPQSICVANAGGATPASSAALTAFLAAATATDGCSTPVAMAGQLNGVDITASTFFAAGPNVVTFRYRDGAGNIGSAPSSVTIRLFGDLNEDNVVNVMDLVIMANYLVGNLQQGQAPFTAPATMADLNQDGSINAVDLVILANYLVGNIKCLPTP